MAALVATTALAAAEEPSVAPQEPPAPAFQPAELSIGEPIPLPFGGRNSPPAAPDAPTGTAVPPSDDPRAAAIVIAPAGSAVPGSGWLGVAVAESNVPGRWRVEEVTAGGPAARAGIAVGDELRAVNGVALASDAEVSQALTSIAAGQDVRVAVARADRVSDIVLRAEPRPTPTTISATTQTTTPAANGPAWQASQALPTQDTPRFGPAAPAREPPPIATRAPATMPRPPTAPAPVPTPRAHAGGGSPAGTSPATGRTALGVRSVPVDPATQTRFNLASPAGAYVVGVVHDLPAARAGVPPGSVIVALDDHPVRSPGELTDLVTRGPLDKPVTVQFVLPGGEEKRTDVMLQALDSPLERALSEGPQRAPGPPDLQPGPVPRRVERRPDDEGPVRTEIRALRARLERLEQLLAPRGGGR